MFHKKTLGAAIAVALSFGVGAAQAATLGAYLYGATAATNQTSPPKIITMPSYAYEQFGNDKDTGVLGFPFRVRYTLSKSMPNTFDFYITFTLSGGATWGEALTSQNLDIQGVAGNSLKPPTSTVAPDVSIVNKGSVADSTVSFLVNSSKKTMDTDQIMDFHFKVSNAHKALKTVGGEITLSVNLTIAQTAKDFVTGTPADTAINNFSLTKSIEGAEITFEQGENAANPAYISVVADGKTFEGPGIETDTQIVYGVVGLNKAGDAFDNGATCVPSTTGKGGYLSDNTGVLPCPTGVGGWSWDPSADLSKGYLLIEDGNFSASGKATDGNVYIDVKGLDKKIAADEFTNTTTAKWDLDTTDLGTTMLDQGNLDIVLTVKGDTEINENRQIQPKGTLAIEFDGGNSVTRSTFLRHLKKNGTVCTLYNIPPSNALDIVNIRVTNDSPSVDGFLKGKLRDMDNKVIFTGKTLIEQGNLKPHQTVRLQMEDLTADGASWTGRAVLVLESNIPHPLMQVYGLLRAREATGFPETPLMNMSTGATGNSCD